ncbi:MAG: L,D-transpeptidase family protein, partial [Gammaproteobacteria bacterium]
AARELLASEALARLAFTLHFGKANPAALDANFNYSRGFGATDPVAWLRAAIEGDRLAATLAALRPPGPYYARLVAALAMHRALAARGGWPRVPAGDTLEPGMRDARVPSLRARLHAGGEVLPMVASAEAEVYDDALADAVRIFQYRHGLTVDALVGPATLAALNVPVAARIATLRVNLERLRWVFRDIGERYVAVNIASFGAAYLVDGAVQWSARAIVGRPYRQTPVFRDTINYLELNPTWTVPPTILRKDILPRLRTDPGYLVEKRLRVIDPNGGPVDPATIDWRAVRAASFPYLLRQEPGPDNALGRIKFMFPNRHAVYLHDTPQRQLFARAERVFSSGCIRVENPLALATLLLADDPAWDRAALEAAIARGRTERVRLARPVPILLLYLTAFADPHGALHFRDDVYGRDAPVLRALEGPLRLQAPAL